MQQLLLCNVQIKVLTQINLITLLTHPIEITVNNYNYSCFKRSLGFSIYISFLLLRYLAAFPILRSLYNRFSVEFTGNHKHRIMSVTKDV